MAKFPDLVIASFGANRKDKPNGVATARVLHYETNSLTVNTRTRIRDQGEVSDRVGHLKRARQTWQQPTFALTAGVSEAHRSGANSSFRLEVPQLSCGEGTVRFS